MILKRRSGYTPPTPPVIGCMVSYATNYNPLATQNAGCIFPNNSAKILVAENSPELITGHGIYVKQAVDQGYGATVSGDITGTGFSDAFNRCVDTDYQSLIHSYSGSQGYLSQFNALYAQGTQGFMPLGSNDHILIASNMSKLICVGAGATENICGYGNALEFWDEEYIGSPVIQSSLSNGIIAGKIKKIKDTLSCSWWQARYRARITADRNEARRPANTIWTQQDGFGKINVSAAIAWVGSIPQDPFEYSGNVYEPFLF